jgi:hypothetical protein
MRRREFIASLVSTVTAWPFAGLAQTASKAYRIGILSTDGPVDAKSIFDAMLSAFARRGYIPDRNMVFEIRASGVHCAVQRRSVACQCVRLSPWQSAMPVNQVPPTLLLLADEVTR